MNEHIDNEAAVHGQQWETLHGGYFADPAVAGPLVETVRQAVAESRPDAVVDLGGGTGFLLSQLAAQCTSARLVNVDCSDAQLAVVGQAGISCLRGSVSEFSRRDAAREGERLLLMMRSVLHYFGEDGLGPVLSHLRSQASDGERFVHQTACFEEQTNAACLNALYQKMRTGKWYPTVGQLHAHQTDAGWRLADVDSEPAGTQPAPPLELTSRDLARRYGLSPGDIARIRSEMSDEFGEIDGVFELQPDGFSAWLHYRIWSCTAA